jgi:alkanesulfonate monooxygenase SsuD/methylene tetrahydromethanopterin reductase-like flavin-dependent oxidoreductase (luciferase family)
MQVGVQMVFQSYGYPTEVTDSQVYDEEVALAEHADAVGLDSIWPVEHHFEDYSFCPDNVVFLAHMAARTSHIKLATGAVIMPWNDPLRVAEKIALLDQLSGGRVLPW